MAKDVIMPVLGMNQDTAVLLAWLKNEGDRVAEGEPIMEVETDKATMELDAPASGTLAGVRAGAGDEVKVGTVVAVILADGEEAPAGEEGSSRTGARGSGPAAAERPSRAGADAAPDAGADARSRQGGRVTAGSEGARPEPGAPGAGSAPAERGEPAPVGGGSGLGRAGAEGAAAGAAAAESGIVPASPKARRLAAEQGVTLEALRGRGRGPEGAVLAADVLEAARAGIATAATRSDTAPEITPAITAAALAPAAAPLRFERVLDADPLLVALDRARGRSAGEAPLDTEAGDLIARFLAAVWSRQSPAPRAPGAHLRYLRVEDGRVSEANLPLAEAARPLAIARARAAAASRAAAPAELTLLDLTRSRAELAAQSALPSGGLLTVVVGRLHERTLPVAGEPRVTRAFRLTFAFDAGRVGLAEAAAFSDRVLALVEEPAALALLY